MTIPININNHRLLHRTIIDKVSLELSELSKDCHYPRIASIHKELLHQCNSIDKELIKYSKQKYKNAKWKLLHDPKNVLIIELIKYFLIQHKDSAAALSLLNLLSLKFYSSTMYILVPYCNDDYYRMALSRLSNNHLYKKHDTIPQALLYLSKAMFQKYMRSFQSNDQGGIIKFIYELRTRLFQSNRSFATLYHISYKEKDVIKSMEKQEYFTPTIDSKVKIISTQISKDVTVYKKIDNNSRDISRNITKFNKNLSEKYINRLTDVKYADSLMLCVYLLIKYMIQNNIDNTQINNYIAASKLLMGIKVTKQQIYYKGVLSTIHDSIIKDIDMVMWYNKLSVQSRATSKSFLSYYISLITASYLTHINIK